ncbi:uncharacterized protein GGS22DRAFT_190851 [Annulohypoxylon maeteangense]|uniref:uncharacterized protein n=1 Tax=Annulohypoxylon maeteangense TaxID=1927788 RepID=UPI0020080B41|nr:uncharacterized protein GGS22DRAFT_190851 [Annulohypoxylon maeteangense]KAI0882872.1 hypothetical protein GGS22DRAFT_190851 [Annulohypoxylon maeteangense]
MGPPYDGQEGGGSGYATYGTTEPTLEVLSKKKLPKTASSLHTLVSIKLSTLIHIHASFHKMALSNTARTCSAVFISSAITIIALLLLIRPGHENMVATLVDDMRAKHSVYTTGNSQPKLTECPAPHSSQELSPTNFVEDPWKYPVYNRKESKGIDWWEDLLTPNGGFLMVKEQGGEINEIGVSMFHQLHCLSMVRAMLLKGGSHMDHVHVENRDMNQGAKDRGHFLHCFDYIVQAILCTADDALERSGKVPVPGGEEVDGINGVGQTHQCRNATLLYDYVLQSEKIPVEADLVGKYSVF